MTDSEGFLGNSVILHIEQIFEILRFAYGTLGPGNHGANLNAHLHKTNSSFRASKLKLDALFEFEVQVTDKITFPCKPSIRKYPQGLPH